MELENDQLTVYADNARRLQQWTLASKSGRAVIQLPETFLESSVLAVSEDKLQLLPSQIRKHELVISLPAGQVEVTDDEGNQLRGTLEAIDSSNAVIRSSEAGQSVQVRDYQSLRFLEREPSQRIELSYFMRSVGWQPRHVVLMSQDEQGAFRIVSLKTNAVIHNHTGTDLDVTQLFLSIGQPFETAALLSANTGGGGEDEEENEERQEKRNVYERKAAATPMMMMQMAASPSAPEHQFVTEDTHELSLGPQRIGPELRLEVLSFQSLPTEKIYVHTLRHDNRQVLYGFQTRLPKGAIVPAGPVTVYSIAAPSLSSLGRQALLQSFLGSTTLTETQHGGKDINLLLGRSSLVTATTIIEDQPVQLEHQESVSDLSAPPPTRGDKEKIRTAYILRRIHCDVRNFSAQHPALVILKYPLNVDQSQIISMDCTPTKMEQGELQFVFRIRPQSQELFVCTMQIAADYIPPPRMYT